MINQMAVERLTPSDLDAALRLSTQVGWNQVAADWERALDLIPDGCLAGRIEGRLVATSTLAAYGTTAAWVGMVIVDPDYRGRGLGTAMLKKALDLAGDRGIDSIGLDATDLGRPVYLKLGFVDVAPIDRWSGVPKDASFPVRAEPTHTVEDLGIDTCGMSRRELLGHLLGEPGVKAWKVPGAGFAVLRPGRAHSHLGPVIARDPSTLRSLLAAAAGQSLLIDAFRTPENEAVLSDAGLAVQRRLMRMTHPRAEPLLTGPGVVAATSFEWG